MRRITLLIMTALPLVLTHVVLADDIRVVQLITNDIVYDPVSRSIYASVPSRAGSIGNSITQVNPVTGAIGPSVFVGSEPSKLIKSDNSQYLYVGLDGAGAVRRFDLTTQTAGMQFSLGKDPTYGPYKVGDMAVAPGIPSVIAVARQYLGGRMAGVAIFDNGVQRPNTIAESDPAEVELIEFSASPSILYGGPRGSGIAKMAVDNSGVSVLKVDYFLFAQGVAPDYTFDNGLIYSSSGNVVDPKAAMIVGSFETGTRDDSLVLPVSALGRVYFLSPLESGAGNSLTARLQAFDQNTHQLLGFLDIPGINGNPSSLIRWGESGLAFRTNLGQLFLIQTCLVPSSQTSPVSRVVPVVVDVVGNGKAHFSTELTLVNQGTTTANLQLTYTASSSLGPSGSGKVSETLAPGQQLIVPDALSYLRSKGLRIPTNPPQGGSLRVDFSDLSSPGAGFAGART
ncbi:MAG: hypothetical protein DMG06_19665, partial [Acidobacteria bacterium]